MSKNDAQQLKREVEKRNLQGHICIQDSDSFNDAVRNGIYGFPHKGDTKKISYFRSVSSLYNIGKDDLIFLYRKKGNCPGCQEINGPFRATSLFEEPDIFYDKTDSYPVLIKGKNTGWSRFLFEKAHPQIRSITNNYKLVEKFEKRKIWGFRHPAVINIGAARKKSIAALTTRQTIELLDLLFDDEHSTSRSYSINNIPSSRVKNYYEKNIDDRYSNKSYHPLTEKYIKNIVKKTNDPPRWEYKIYPYLIRGFRRKKSKLSKNLYEDFENINKSLLSNHGITFEKISENVVQEAIASTHLQEEMEILLSDSTEDYLMIMEIKKDKIDQDSIDQAENYIDLLSSIFPKKSIFANIIGFGTETGIVNSRKAFINLIEFDIQGTHISFSTAREK